MQVSGSGEVEVATVQPTVSVSPSVSSASTASSSQPLDPAAAEFYPGPPAATEEEPPRAVVGPQVIIGI